MKQSLLRKKTSLIVSAAFTILSAIIISVIFYSLNNKPYSISHLLRAIILLSCVLFWAILWVVSRNKHHLTRISNRLLSSNKNLIAARIFILAFIILLIIAGLFSLIEFPQINFLTKPNFKYSIKIEPDKTNPGNICIIEIKNSSGEVSIAQNPGSWKRDVFGCEHFLEAGQSGKIIFENIGPIDDEIEIVARADPKAGAFIFTSRPGNDFFITLRSDDYRNLRFVFNLGNTVIRRITNWGLKTGYVLILLFLLLLIQISFYKEFGELLDLFSNEISGAYRKKRLIYNTWQFLDSKEAPVILIPIMLIAGVFFSGFLINQIIGASMGGDELVYWNIALNIYKGTFTSAVKYHIAPPFYAISLMPAFYLYFPFKTYTIARLLNALYITSAIIPAYFLLRKFTKRNISMVAIALMLLHPVQLIMPGLMMSENAFYPLFMWTVLFAFTNVLPTSQKNRVIESLIFGILLGLLYLTRYIALAIIPAFIFIWWLKPFENEKLPLLFSVRKALHLIIILIPLILIIGGWMNFRMAADGLIFKDMLGYTTTGDPSPGQLSFGRLIMWAIFYCSFAILIAAPYLPILLVSLSRFKIKDWQEDSNRWLIALAAIILFFLAVCIRHSWRVNYNYPIPVKLQGRYLYTFGSLFLITIFINLEKTLKSINQMKLIKYSSAMITVAYIILFVGIKYLIGPLPIAPASPDGELIKAMGISFIALTLANVVLSSSLVTRKRIALFTFIVTFLFGFFIYGNAKIIQNKINTSTQRMYSQINYLVQELKKFSPEGIDKDQHPLSIYIPNKAAGSNWITLWHRTLLFNGYTDINMEQYYIAEVDPAIVLQARNGDYLINLRELTEKEYLISKNKKYSLTGKFFEFQVMPNN